MADFLNKRIIVYSSLDEVNSEMAQEAVVDSLFKRKQSLCAFFYFDIASFQHRFLKPWEAFGTV